LVAEIKLNDASMGLLPTTAMSNGGFGSNQRRARSVFAFNVYFSRTFGSMLSFVDGSHFARSDSPWRGFQAALKSPSRLVNAFFLP
jgi:hypothetical protein